MNGQRHTNIFLLAWLCAVYFGLVQLAALQWPTEQWPIFQGYNHPNLGCNCKLWRLHVQFLKIDLSLEALFAGVFLIAQVNCAPGDSIQLQQAPCAET